MLEHLDAAGVRRWAEHGVAGLARHRAEIDALNVFPVPDGDTGTNMYLTLEAARDNLGENPDPKPDQNPDSGEPGDTLHGLARGALLGARGNSGIILSQLLRGFADACAAGPGTRAGHLTDLGVAFRRAADSAYASVADPREGTILSVARGAADAVEALGPGTSLQGQVIAAADGAAEALARTPDQLEVLRRAGVVDAGGRGLVVVLEALVETVTGLRREAGPSAPPIPRDVHDLDPGGGVYEVMFLLDADDAAGMALRARLAALGDSVVVVGGAGLWNVHVHCDDVGAAVEAGVEAGRPHRIRVTHLREDAAQRRGGRPRGRAVVAVAHGDGTAGLLEAAGAIVVRALPNVAPSTAELLAGIERTGVDEVVLLPSESDIRPVAEAAAEHSRADGLRVSVVPTRSIVQTLAAVAVHDPELGYDDDVVRMTQAAGATRYGGVSVASREAVTSAGRCQVGDVLGIVGGDVVEIGATVEQVAVAVLERLLSTGGELVTLVEGAGADGHVAAAVSRRVRRSHHGVETVVFDGGQPFWPLILGVE